MQYIKYIQFPFNIIDTRWKDAIRKIKIVKLERDLKIHVRSALLQGLLLTDDKSKWGRANLIDAKPVLDWLTNTVEKMRRKKSFKMIEGHYFFSIKMGYQNKIMISRKERGDAAYAFSNYIKQNKECEWLGLWDGSKFTDSNFSEVNQG